MTRKRKPVETIVERRLRQGSRIIATHNDDGKATVWNFADDGRCARSDVVERLLAGGVLVPMGDGLFPEDSQTYGLAPA